MRAVRSPYTESWYDVIHAAAARGIPVYPMAMVRKEAPARMKAIMHEVWVAPTRLWTKFDQVSEP